MHKQLHILVLFFIFGCTKKVAREESTQLIRIKKESKVESPKPNTKFVRGATIPFTVTATTIIDSLIVTINEERQKFFEPTFEVVLPNRRVGTWKVKLKVFCKDTFENHTRKVIILPENSPEKLTYEIINTYPHNTEDYTQGLLIKDGYLFESTGQRGKSTFKKKELTTGKDLKIIHLDEELFGEGLTFYEDRFYQLTWKAGKVLVYSKEMELEKEIPFLTDTGEGWGLEVLGDYLLLTDNSEKIYFVDPTTFAIQKELEIYDHSGPVKEVNELEIIDGLLYGNIYQTEDIVVIDPETGEVLQRIDCSGLLSDKEAKTANVLNGIARDPETGKIYLSGKLWPKLFEVKFLITQ